MVQVGDHIRMRRPVEARKALNVTYEILQIPLRENMAPTWWEMRGDSDGLVYIFDTPVTFTIEP